MQDLAKCINEKCPVKERCGFFGVCHKRKHARGCARGASSDERALIGGDTPADELPPRRKFSSEVAHLQMPQLRRSRRGRR